MQLETLGWFSIYSDSNCYCVLSLPSLTVAFKPWRGDLASVSGDSDHSIIFHSKSACVWGNREERRSQPQHWLQKLPAIIPSLPQGSRAETLVSRETASTFIYSDMFHRMCKGLLCIYSLVQHHAVAQVKCCSLMKCFKIYFSGEEIKKVNVLFNRR